MSRSIGDDVATSVGVTWEPEIFEFELDQYDKFMVIASDGVILFFFKLNFNFILKIGMGVY